MFDFVILYHHEGVKQGKGGTRVMINCGFYVGMLISQESTNSLFYLIILAVLGVHLAENGVQRGIDDLHGAFNFPSSCHLKF